MKRGAGGGGAESANSAGGQMRDHEEWRWHREKNAQTKPIYQRRYLLLHRDLPQITVCSVAKNKPRSRPEPSGVRSEAQRA